MNIEYEQIKNTNKNRCYLTRLARPSVLLPTQLLALHEVREVLLDLLGVPEHGRALIFKWSQTLASV